MDSPEAFDPAGAEAWSVSLAHRSRGRSCGCSTAKAKIFGLAEDAMLGLAAEIAFVEDASIVHPLGLIQLNTDPLASCKAHLFPGFAKGWFPKGWFWRMFPRNENRNEGTFAKTTLLQNCPFISQ